MAAHSLVKKHSKEYNYRRLPNVSMNAADLSRQLVQDNNRTESKELMKDLVFGLPGQENKMKRLVQGSRRYLPRVLAFVILTIGMLLVADLAWAQDPPAETPPQPEGKGFLGILFSGGWVGTLIVLLLFALSLTAAFLVFDNAMTIRRTELLPAALSEQVHQLLLTRRTAQAEELCRSQPGFLSFVLLNGLAEVESGWASVEKALEDALAEQSARLMRKIEYLSVIGNIAPMVGLLGTVTGMIFAFQRVAVTHGSAGADELAEGIYQALVTTVGGLIVAIPSLGAFAIFRNWVDQLTAEAAYIAQHVFRPLKRNQVGAPPPAPNAPPAAPPGSAPPPPPAQ